MVAVSSPTRKPQETFLVVLRPVTHFPRGVIVRQRLKVEFSFTVCTSHSHGSNSFGVVEPRVVDGFGRCACLGGGGYTREAYRFGDRFHSFEYPIIIIHHKITH
jgi:hypothetical protein